MHQFPKFTPAWNSTCFWQFLCPSSGVYSLYIRHWYMSHRFVDSFRAGPGWSCSIAVYKPVGHIPVANVQWINSWWWAEELPKTCRVSCRSKFGKLVHLVGSIIMKAPNKFDWSGIQIIYFITLVVMSRLAYGLMTCGRMIRKDVEERSVGLIWDSIAVCTCSGVVRKTTVRTARLAEKYETSATNSAAKFGKI